MVLLDNFEVKILGRLEWQIWLIKTFKKNFYAIDFVEILL